MFAHELSVVTPDLLLFSKALSTGLEPFGSDEHGRELRDTGLVTLTVHPGTVFLLALPLVVEPTEVDRIVEIIGDGLIRMEGHR